MFSGGIEKQHRAVMGYTGGDDKLREIGKTLHFGQS